MSLLTKLPPERYDPNAFAAFASEEGFSLGKGKAMAWMSQLAYELDEPDKVRTILQKWGLALDHRGIIVKEVATVLPLASTHVFVASGRGATMVVFAGTDPLVLANWISDFDTHLSSTGIADGFALAAEIVWPDLFDLLAAANAENANIFVTGHSLSGALAALTAKKIADAGRFSLLGVYMFGMPRVGNEEWHRQYTDKIGQRSFRLVYGEDIVPTVAPSSWGFRHIGRLLRCRRGSKFRESHLAPDLKSDEPKFERAATKDIRTFLHSPASIVLSTTQRIKVALGLVIGLGPANMRADPAGIAIELLPPRLQDHMPDRYTGAFETPPRDGATTVTRTNGRSDALAGSPREASAPNAVRS